MLQVRLRCLPLQSADDALRYDDTDSDIDSFEAPALSPGLTHDAALKHSLSRYGDMLGASPHHVARAITGAAASFGGPLHSMLGVSLLSVLAVCGVTPIRHAMVYERESGSFRLDPMQMTVEAPVAGLLELDRLRGFRPAYLPSRDLQMHLFYHTERSDASSNAVCRTYLRAALRAPVSDELQEAIAGPGGPGLLQTLVATDLGELLGGALRELGSTSFLVSDRMQPCDWSHLFLAFLYPLPGLGNSDNEAQVAHALRAAGAALMSQHAAALRKAAASEVEIRLRCDQGLPWRLVLCLPTGHEQGEEHVEVYRESRKPDGSPGVALRPLDSSAGASPVDLLPYTHLDRLQYKRLAARRFQTTYCYDFPAVFESALRELWADARDTGLLPLKALTPSRLVEVQELGLRPSGQGAVSSFRGELSGALEPIHRPLGSNRVGMVAWLMVLRTPECPEGRQVVVVSNDITFSSGAFGPLEDTVFKAATELALARRLPLLYLAANAGARVGLATEVREYLQVEWVQPEDPSKGFHCLYLEDQDYRSLCERAGDGVVRVRPEQGPDGRKRWVLTDIIGLEDGLGVECLSGSGAIAGAYCRAWNEGLTLTLVTGRSVGIGAYLARLGRRCVQRGDQPLILTGYQALNKLLQREVYTSQLQLGGPKVMGRNGVSHHVVPDDLAGVKTLLRWLGYMPATAGDPPAALPCNDPIYRDAIAGAPRAGDGAKLDARAAIAGIHEGCVWIPGLFDKGSWSESQSGWAKTVITGRARLGGHPVGIIAVETNIVSKVIPADPGASDSVERTELQAGQVWYPDSALKTAQAMEEFDREGLPLFILANWRGFSGGQRDLFEGVLQAGSLIVEALRSYRRPVFVYLPPGAELRGGAWVVIDSQINAEKVGLGTSCGSGASWSASSLLHQPLACRLRSMRIRAPGAGCLSRVALSRSSSGTASWWS